MNEQRRKTLCISSNVLPLFFGAAALPYRVTEDPLPDDAVVVNCRMSFDGRTLELLIESAGFDPVPDGEVYPEILPRMTVIPEHPPARPSPN